MKNKKSKILTLLSVTAAALQIPLLMLWAIIVNTLRLSCHRLEASKIGRAHV